MHKVETNSLLLHLSIVFNYNLILFIIQQKKPFPIAHCLSSRTFMRLQGLEPWTNRLRVYCSTNWAKGAFYLRACLCFEHFDIIQYIKVVVNIFFKKDWNYFYFSFVFLPPGVFTLKAELYLHRWLILRNYLLTLSINKSIIILKIRRWFMEFRQLEAFVATAELKSF